MEKTEMDLTEYVRVTAFGKTEGYLVERGTLIEDDTKLEFNSRFVPTLPTSSPGYLNQSQQSRMKNDVRIRKIIIVKTSCSVIEFEVRKAESQITNGKS